MRGDDRAVASGGVRPQHLYKAVGLAFLLVLLVHYLDPVARILLITYAAAVLAVALNVLVGLVPRRRRLVSVGLGLLIFAALALTLWFAVPALGNQLRGLAGEIPRLEAQLQRWSAWVSEQTGIRVRPPGETTTELVNQAIGRLQALATARGVIEVIFLPFVIIIGALYAVATPNDRLLSPLLRAVPRERRESFRRGFALLGDRLKGWVRGLLLGMIAVGILTGVGLWILGVRYPLLLGLIAGVLEIVPILGPWVAGVIAVAVAFLDDPTRALWVALLMLAVQQIESNLITPLVMAQSAEVHPFITLFALLLFGATFGFLGIVLALPLVLLIWTAVEVLWVDRAIHTESDAIEPLVNEG